MSKAENNQPKSYADLQAALVDRLVEGHVYTAATNTVAFDAEKLEHPEGITTESINNHVDYFNRLSGAVEQATVEITHQLHEKEDANMNVESNLMLGNMAFYGSHTLKQDIGDETIYGASTTITQMVQTEEAADWLVQQRDKNIAMAEKLFS